MTKIYKTPSRKLRIEQHEPHYINMRENRRGKLKWTVQRYWQHWVSKTQDGDKNIQHRKLKRWATRIPYPPPKNTEGESRCSRRV